MTRPIFYSFRRCPYAMRARLAVQSAQIECEYREVVLRDKPAHMLEISPKGTVPVMLTPDETVIEESLDIMRWALEQNDPESLMTPENGTIDDMGALIAQCDGDFKGHLDRYKYPDRYDGIDAVSERTKGEFFLSVLETQLNGSEYLFGSRISLADLAIAPFIRQFANTGRDWFDNANYPNVQNWLGRFLDSERFTAIMPKQKQWHEGDELTIFPFVED